MLLSQWHAHCVNTCRRPQSQCHVANSRRGQAAFLAHTVPSSTGSSSCVCSSQSFHSTSVSNGDRAVTEPRSRVKATAAASDVDAIVGDLPIRLVLTGMTRPLVGASQQQASLYSPHQLPWIWSPHVVDWMDASRLFCSRLLHHVCQIRVTCCILCTQPHHCCAEVAALQSAAECAGSIMFSPQTILWREEQLYLSGLIVL